MPAPLSPGWQLQRGCGPGKGAPGEILPPEHGSFQCSCPQTHPPNPQHPALSVGPLTLLS